MESAAIARHNAAGFDERLRGLGGILWDLDNTLYRLDDMMEDLFNVAIARAAIDCGLVMDFDDAVAMARTAYAKTGYSGRYFVDHYGIGRDELHFAFHRHMDEKVITASLVLQDMVDAARLSHALITHGARDWARRVLQHIGLKHHFPDEQIFALEDTGFEKKSESERGYRAALGVLRLPPEKVVMMEDLAENLVIPKRMGMGTVWLHHGRVPEIVPDHVDFCCANAFEFMQHYHLVRFGAVPAVTSV